VIGKEGNLAISNDKARVCATVKKEMKETIKKLAEEENRSESAMAAILLKIGLEGYIKK
jgi:hypothetical protein